MKKLFVIVAAVMVSSAVFSQDTKTAAPATAATPAKAETAATPATHEHGYFMMKDNVLMHCKGEAMTPVKADVKLKNGTVITAKGEVTSKEGTKSQLANGQCCNMSGHMGDCEKMKASMAKAETKPAAK